ncbi:MAG: HD domain-containing protein [Patescibacteria group bacterium]|nr:HD domain-containing protein [Patescibacteria group bacterium]
MNSRQKDLIKLTEKFVRKKFSGEGTGHDWWHVAAVRRNAVNISKREGGDRFVIELAALLHELDDIKLTHEKSDKPVTAARWLARLGVDKQRRMLILRIVERMSFRKSLEVRAQKPLEQQIVEDADRLEVLGAIGIARVFAFGGKLGRPMYDPMVKPRKNITYAQYIQRGGDSISHFYEKVLLLKNRMNTRTGKKLAKSRHNFVVKFLREFFKEWKGKA